MDMTTFLLGENSGAVTIITPEPSRKGFLCGSRFAAHGLVQRSSQLEGSLGIFLLL